jgi:hypothetical protein
MNARPRMSRTQKRVLIFVLLFPICFFAELLQSAARFQRDNR